jgi:pimeloyl-ACP methyl ester carboxylesterase
VVPHTRYAKRPEGMIAYQVLGDGPLDLIFVDAFPTNVEIMWEEPGIAHFLRRLGSFSRLICYDHFGHGVSDRYCGTGHALDSSLDDMRAVMDAVGSQRVVLFGHGEGGMMVMLFAATYPERVSSLILADSAARRIRAPDYEWGIPGDEFDRIAELFDQGFGTGAHIDVLAPSRAQDRAFRDWFGRYSRLTIGPTDAATVWRGILLRNDLRPVLPSIRQPTLVLHHGGNRYIRVGHGRYLAQHIPNAKYVELPGEDHLYYVGDSDVVLNEVQEFLTGARHVFEEDRVLATVLFADIVDSTERAAELGDRRWRELLERYYEMARREVTRYRGREVDTAGDSFFATFDGPARPIRCACTLRDVVSSLGISIRAGLHTGECERMGDKVGGIAVHTGARVAGQAQPGEVLVSSTVKDLVAGSGLQFHDRGVHALKGVPGEWRLFAVAQGAS